MVFSFCKRIISNSQSFKSLLDSKRSGRFLFQLDTYIVGLQHLYFCAHGIHLDTCVRCFFFSNNCAVWNFPPRSWLAPRHCGVWLSTLCLFQKKCPDNLVHWYFYTLFFSKSQHPLLQVDSWHNPTQHSWTTFLGTSFVHLVAALLFNDYRPRYSTTSERQNKVDD